MKIIVLFCAVYALLLGTVRVKALVENNDQIEQSTESPIADMALLDTKVDNMQAESVTAAAMNNTSDKFKDEGKIMGNSQQHTIADFVIHPLIALKPREPVGEGKQADTSSTTPSPWQLFGFNAGQGLGSQVSSLAGSVTGWLGNRIQIPGFIDTPVRESITSTTTTTPKPDVVVRVKQRGSTKKPLITIKGDNDAPYRKTKRPNKFNDWEEEDDEDFYDEDEEDEEEEVFNNKRKRYQNNNYDDEDEDYEYDEEGDDEDEDNNVDEAEQDDEAEEEDEEELAKPIKQNNKRRRNPRPLINRRRINHNQNNNQRKRFNNNGNTSRRQQQRPKPYYESEEQYDDYDEAEQEQKQDFYYNKNLASKRSQTEQNFIQRGQGTLIKQIKQLTGRQTPAEVSEIMRKTKKSDNKKRRNQATLIIKRNGQAIYVAPELLQVTDGSNGNNKPAGQQLSVTSSQVKKPSSHYPQPPLSVPYKRKGKPAQYITIPWSQLGISPPDDVTALTNGVQSKPFILNIPQSAINNMQYPKIGKRKPSITPEAVPLLADASIMDIFKPPRIPPARTPSTTKPTKKVSTQSHSPVLIATGPTRIRPATIVEKAPVEANTNEKLTSEEALSDATSSQLIVIDDGPAETHLTRNEYKKILEYFNSRSGRQLNDQKEQLIPVKVISAENDLTPTPEVAKIDDKIEMENVTEIPIETTITGVTESIVENATESPVNI